METEGSNYSIGEYQSSSSSGDRDRKNNNNMQWTDEKHWHYLRFLEDAFVQSMFQTNNIITSRCRRERKGRLRLDRYVPDSSESTSDVKKNIVKRKKNISCSSTDEAESSTDKLDPRMSSTGRRRRRLAATADRYSIISRDPEVPAVGVGKR